jgi:glycosyltransferase involved in cell wall biosynthesis
VRRYRDWQTLHADCHFDRSVSRQLRPAEIFHGATGQCLNSLDAARRIGCRTILDVVTLHVDDLLDAQIEGCSQFGIRPTLHPREHRRISLEYQRADRIRVMSRRAERSFVERGFDPGRLVVAHPPFDLGEFPPAAFDEPVFRISYVGLLEPWKGFQYLVDAYEKLRLPHGELVLWGGSGSRPVYRYLQEKMRANPSIKLRPVSVREVGYGAVYAKSSVLVNPSLADGFGYVVGEALASGIPVIVTSETGARDLVVDGANGYVIPARDPDALADRLAHLSRNPGLTRQMGRNARESMRRHTPEAFATHYASWVGKMLA